MMFEYPFVIYRGDTYRRGFKLWSDTAKTVPVDLTGVTVDAEVRNRPGGAMIAPLLCTVVGSEVTVELSATMTRLMPAAGVWDLQLTYPSSEVRTIIYGPVRVDGNVTASSRLVVPPDPPTLTSLVPNHGPKGTTVPVTVTGTNFVGGATLVNVSNGITASNIIVASDTVFTVDFVIIPGATSGTRPVTVETAAGISASLTFSVDP